MDGSAAPLFTVTKYHPPQNVLFPVLCFQKNSSGSTIARYNGVGQIQPADGEIDVYMDLHNNTLYEYAFSATWKV